MHDMVKLETVELVPFQPGKPLVVLGPSLGTSAAALWGPAAVHLAGRFNVLGVDLPGHGVSWQVAPVNDMAALAKAVIAGVDAALAKRGEAGTQFFYAGVSVSGCIGLQLLLDAPERVRAAGILNSAAKIGEKAAWLERAATVRSAGTKAMREASPGRWFAPGFAEANPVRVAILLDSLSAASGEGYAGVCEALGSFDVRDKLSSIKRPVIAIGGKNDVATPPEQQEAIAKGIPGARLEFFSPAGHLVPAEHPEKAASLLAGFFGAIT